MATRSCATLPNIHCPGQREIDLLAINLASGERFHIETSVSISGVYSRLTDKVFDPILAKQRVQAAGQRRTVGFFVTRKFGDPLVVETLARFGFVDGSYTKVIVSWDWTPGAEAMATANGIVLWSLRNLMTEIASEFRGTRRYFTDDTMRTLHLFDRVTRGGES